MQPAGVKSLRKQCARQSLAFFFKEWGGFQKKKAGRKLEGRIYDAMPLVPDPTFPTEAERMRRVHEAEAVARHLATRGHSWLLRVLCM